MVYTIGQVERKLDNQIYKDCLYSGANGHDVTKTMYPDGDPERLPLEPSLKLRNHSPTGFSWGYGGSGPSQLALALLLDATGESETALSYYQEFKWDLVSGWPVDRTWSMWRSEIIKWLRIKSAESINIEKN